jgi:hypothetical protein
VFENRILRQIFGPNREEVRGDCRKLQSWELRGLYSSDIWTMKSRKMRWVIHVECMEDKTCVQGFCGKTNEIDCLEDLGIYGRVILKWILKK